MHWIDPTSLPALSGEVERFIINPRGDLDGVVLAGGGLVHFPPHLSEAVATAIRPGDPITVHGVRLRGVDMVAAVSLTAKSGEVIIDEGPEAHAKKHMRKHERPKRQKLDARGTVRLPLFGPKGELRGALLDDGTVLRVGAKEAARLSGLLKPAAAIEARGEGLETKHGRVIEVSEIAAAGSKLNSVKSPERDKDGKHQKEEPRAILPR
jgi:hypothetical protein